MPTPCNWCGDRHDWEEACDEAAHRRIVASIQLLATAINKLAPVTIKAEAAFARLTELVPNELV